MRPHRHPLRTVTIPHEAISSVGSSPILGQWRPSPGIPPHSPGGRQCHLTSDLGRGKTLHTPPCDTPVTSELAASHEDPLLPTRPCWLAAHLGHTRAAHSPGPSAVYVRSAHAPAATALPDQNHLHAPRSTESGLIYCFSKNHSNLLQKIV